jgi:hypothetical protein
LSNAERASPVSAVTFESTDDDEDKSSSSSGDFFCPKGADSKRPKPEARIPEKLCPPTKVDIEKILNSKSLAFDDDDDRKPEREYPEEKAVFSESDDTDDEDDDDASGKLKVNQVPILRTSVPGQTFMA